MATVPASPSKQPAAVSSPVSKPNGSENYLFEALNDEQVEILKKFRSELVEEGHLKSGDTLGTDDETLIRFLRARKFNLNLAKRMITQCLQWRHQVEGVGIDALYDEIDPFNYPNRDKVFQYWPMYYHRIDKVGRPVSIQKLGELDLNKLYTIINKETHFKTLLVSCESLTREVIPACSYRKSQLQNSRQKPSKSDPTDQSTTDSSGTKTENSSETVTDSSSDKVTSAFCIVDLKGFTLGQFWNIKSIARTCFSISQDYYPETMGYLAIINAPRSIATIFKAVQPWLSQETISKINILGDDYKTILLEHIDEKNLPDYLGGKCKCDESEPWRCIEDDDPEFDQSPWLKARDWKNQSWKKFTDDEKSYGQDEKNKKEEDGTQTGSKRKDKDITQGKSNKKDENNAQDEKSTHAENIKKDESNVSLKKDDNDQKVNETIKEEEKDKKPENGQESVKDDENKNNSSSSSSNDNKNNKGNDISKNISEEVGEKLKIVEENKVET